MPEIALGVMLGAYQDPMTAPPNSWLCFCCIKKPRGVWPSPQCAAPSTRYLPRFHSADCEGSGANGFESRNSAFQNAIEKRMLYGNGSEVCFAAGSSTGWTCCMK